MRLGGDEEEGSVVSGGFFEGDSDGNLEGVGPEEGDTLVVSSVTEVCIRQGPDG